MIQENLARIREKIDVICHRVKRDPAGITLVAVTKFADPSMVAEAIDSGVTHIGENKVQQALDKYPPLTGNYPDVTKHMIGHLQTNKVKGALELFDLIQSVDSLKLAEEIQKRADSLNKQINILLQVNTSGEEQKFGLEVDETIPFLKRLEDFPSIRVQGLMTIAPFTQDEQIVRSCFRKLRELLEQIKKKFPDRPNIDMKYLSMGMSADYEIAIEEGSNMLRIGRVIFQE